MLNYNVKKLVLYRTSKTVDELVEALLCAVNTLPNHTTTKTMVVRFAKVEMVTP